MSSVTSPIDPSVAMWINIAVMTLGGVSAASLAAMGVPHAEQVAAIVAFLMIPLNAVLHAYSSTQPGPGAPPDPKGPSYPVPGKS